MHTPTYLPKYSLISFRTLLFCSSQIPHSMLLRLMLFAIRLFMYIYHKLTLLRSYCIWNNERKSSYLDNECWNRNGYDKKWAFNNWDWNFSFLSRNKTEVIKFSFFIFPECFLAILATFCLRFVWLGSDGDVLGGLGGWMMVRYDFKGRFCTIQEVLVNILKKSHGNVSLEVELYFRMLWTAHHG